MPTFAERYGQGKLMGLRMLEERRRKQLQEAQLMQLTQRRGEDYMPVPIGKLAEMGMPLDQFMPQATITPGGATVPMRMGAVDRLMRLLPQKVTPAAQATTEKNVLWTKYLQGEPLTKEEQQRIGVWKEPEEPKISTPSEAQRKAERKLRLKEYGEAGVGPQERRDIRLLKQEFREEEPAEWTGRLETQYQGYREKTTDIPPLDKKSWYKQTQIGKPISELTREEDDFIADAKARGMTVIDILWEGVRTKYPTWDIEYIKTQLR